MRGYILGVSTEIVFAARNDTQECTTRCQELRWIGTVNYFLKYFNEEQKAKAKHLILDSRFSTKALFDAINSIN